MITEPPGPMTLLEQILHWPICVCLCVGLLHVCIKSILLLTLRATGLQSQLQLFLTYAYNYAMCIYKFVIIV